MNSNQNASQGDEQVEPLLNNKIKQNYHSIYQYILKWTMVIVLLCGTIMVTSSVYNLNHESQEMFDASLIQSNLLVKAILPNDTEISSFVIPKDLRFQDIVDAQDFDVINEGVGENEGEKVSNYENDLAIIIQDSQQKLIFSTIETTPLKILKEGFSQFTIAGDVWRSFSIYDAKRKLWISSLHKVEVREELSLYVIYSMLPSILITALLLFITILIIVRKGLLPLKQISSDLLLRDQHNLTPISASEMPKELEQIVSALNSMFNKVASSLSRERQFTNDAAHELRTPLSGMRLQLELLENTSSKQALESGVGRMERLVNQLLQLARLEPNQKGQITTENCDLRALIEQSIADIYPLAMSKNVDIELIADSQVNLKANSLLIEILVRNLLENALQYSGTKTIEVILHASESLSLFVIDHGIGLSAENKEKVFQRFYRVDKCEGSGSGLGLAIVDNILTSHNGEYLLKDTEQGGLTVEIKLPYK